MTDQEKIMVDLRRLLDVVKEGTPLLVQASGGPTLTIHDQGLAAKLVTAMMEHVA